MNSVYPMSFLLIIFASLIIYQSYLIDERDNIIKRQYTIHKTIPDSVKVACPHCGWEHTVWIREVNKTYEK